MTTPRVFIIRHGETEWSLNGRHTGTTDIPLTANGEKRIRATGHALVGDDRLIVPKNLAHIYVSPRHRAQRTLELLDLGCKEPMPWQKGVAGEASGRGRETEAKVQVTEAVREWDYGDYEGLTSKTIREQRQEKGEGGWDIWRDGCPGGESPQQISERLDTVIKEIRQKYHGPAIGKPKGSAEPFDVLIVAHGHILRAFAARWIGKDIAENPNLILEAGGVGTLSYEHHSLDEPAILLGGAFMSDVVEQVEQKK
ncbi:phosphoglycerate mutase-like protein [Myriangium duriaei CBS 260.36]|uniref:Phosphoglycerate mutase-like protein n=1 Tax=Myriangium duriaei CBS 260.36 TaxID=1168546 RepID=A0A9P4IZD8_9PEZI|nr:phosphoglycerate mutase-like protein [Myriangium duriaei CBS 260.36]